MLFIVNKTEYPRFLGDLLLVNPNWKDGDDLPEGWEIVDESYPYPNVEKGFRISENLTFTDGKWYRTYEQIEFIGDEEEEEKNFLRSMRDNQPEVWQKLFANRKTAIIEELINEVNNGGDNI